MDESRRANILSALSLVVASIALGFSIVQYSAGQREKRSLRFSSSSEIDGNFRLQCASYPYFVEYPFKVKITNTGDKKIYVEEVNRMPLTLNAFRVGIDPSMSEVSDVENLAPYFDVSGKKIEFPVSIEPAAPLSLRSRIKLPLSGEMCAAIKRHDFITNERILEAMLAYNHFYRGRIEENYRDLAEERAYMRRSAERIPSYHFRMPAMISISIAGEDEFNLVGKTYIPVSSTPYFITKDNLTKVTGEEIDID